MKVFRIADRRRPILDGTGAFLMGGRWNSPGRQVIYAAATYAGALLEQLAHANIGQLPRTQAWITIDIPDSLPTERVGLDEVPEWSADHMIHSRARGDRWLDARSAVALFVPSAVTAGLEWNLLLNPEHADFHLVTASEPRPVVWDPRLIRS